MATCSLPSKYTALVQETYPGPLVLKDVSTPEAVPGSAIVQILCAPVLSYAKEVVTGVRNYPQPVPYTPGPSALGRIAALGPDSTSLKVGQLVHIDCTIRSRDDPTHIFLLGLHQGLSAGSAKLMAETWRDGTWAEYCRAPLENLFPLDEQKLVGEMGYNVNELSSLGRFLVVYGGLRDIGLQAGETIVVAPATGGFGGAAVMMAVAMGANVIAMGRNETILNAMANNHESGRVKTVKITNNIEVDAAAIRKAAGGPIDAGFDISPDAAAKSTHLKSIITSLRNGGRVSLMGGVRSDVPIPMTLIVHLDLTLKGKWMYSPKDVRAVIKLLETGILKFGPAAGLRLISTHPLKDWEKALDVAEENAGWDASVVLTPAEH